MNEITLAVKDGRVTTTSDIIAQHFGKRHSDVLRAIEHLDCSQVFRQRNFALTLKNVTMPNGAIREDKACTLTRDGFTFLCMGFTGKDAAAWKEKYIAAFNAMEAKLKVGAGDTAKKPKLPAPPDFPAIDVRSLLLDGQSRPTVPLSAEVQSAINRRAWALAHEAYELCREHLARRVANHCEEGNPRYLNTRRAMTVIARGDLSQALAHAYYDRVGHIAYFAEFAMNNATKMHNDLQAMLSGELNKQITG